MTTIQPAWDAALVDTLVEEEFLELVCSDEDLVQAEFEAIIAAEWPSLPSPPAARPLHRPADRPPTSPAGPWRVGAPGRLASRPRHPGIGGWARQRSPPHWPNNLAAQDRDG